MFAKDTLVNAMFSIGNPANAAFEHGRVSKTGTIHVVGFLYAEPDSDLGCGGGTRLWLPDAL